jgi:hypothetical protein
MSSPAKQGNSIKRKGSPYQTGAKAIRLATDLAGIATNNPLIPAGGHLVAGAMENMDEDELTAEQQGGAGSSGSNMRRRDVHLDTPFFKHSFECNIKKTTQIQLEWLDKDKAYFFPTAIYDWYLTEPAHNDNAAWTYAYIPGYKDLFFYDTVANRDARKDFFHFVRPLSAHVECKDLLFFTDDVKTAATPVLATYGFESAYLMHGNRYLPEKYFLDVPAATNGYMAQTLFAKETLPICKLARYEAMDSASVNAIHGGSGFSFDVPIHQPLQGHANFVKPILNSYCDKNQGTYTNFTWLPHRNKMFQDNPPTDSSGTAFKDAKEFWTNYKGYKHLGLAGPTRDYACPAHLIWFPQINKADSDVFKLRASFFMTTSLTCRFYSKFPTHEDTAYSALEAYMGQLYTSDNYNTFSKYPVTAVI